MEQKKNKRPHFKPLPGSRPFCLQSRDVEILKLVYELRFATTEHIGHLVGGSYQQIQRRLRLLYDERYLDRPPEQNARRNNKTQHYIYGLGFKGAQHLKNECGIARLTGDWTEKNREARHLTIMHQLMIANFRAVLTLALKEGRGGELVLWRQGKELSDSAIRRQHGRDYHLPVNPDAWFVLRTPEGMDRHFFLEADNSTMRHDRFQKKMEGYFWYYLSGKEENSGEYLRKKNLFGKAKEFRVLTIAKSLERKRNLIITAKEIGPEKRPTRMFWFAYTGNYSLEHPETVLSQIWETAFDGQKKVLI